MHNSTIVFTMLQANKQINVPEYQSMFMYVLVSCTAVQIVADTTNGFFSSFIFYMELHIFFFLPSKISLNKRSNKNLRS